MLNSRAKRLTEIFRIWDEDGNGQLEYDEFEGKCSAACLYRTALDPYHIGLPLYDAPLLSLQ